MEDFENVVWFKTFGWSDNPFKIRSEHRNIIGFIDMRTQILTYMKSDDPFIVTGPTGAGKTTLLKWLEEQKKNSFYFNFLDDIDEKKFKKKIEGTFLEKLIKRFSGSKKSVLIDEVQEMSPELLKWIRCKFDEGEISSLVLASIKEDLGNIEEPFLDRIGNRVVLVRNLTEEEAFKMVRQRMFSKGKTNPFTDEGLRGIFEYSGFSPRKILENCETCCIHAGKEGIRYINHDVVNKALESIEQRITLKKPDKTDTAREPMKEFDIRSLSPSQQKIIDILSEEELTTNKISEMMNVSRASVAKQLSRLSFKTDRKLLESKGFNAPLVEAKNKGRPVVYGLTKEIKRILNE